MTARIYFDNAATTPPDPRVIETAQPYLSRLWGNPSSLHLEGREAHQAVDTARRHVADLIGARPEEIVFTGSGTEADNMAIQGVALAAAGGPCHIIASAVEHPAVLECCRALEQRGVAVSLLPVDDQGIVNPADLERALRSDTRLVSIMTANNVLGTLQPVAELAAIARRHGVLFHTDAVQAAGKIRIDVHSQQIDLLSLSAHKLHGPKGIGALYVRDGVQLPALLPGGGQEGGRRSGTENVAAMVGFGRAAEVARLEMAEEAARLVRIRDFIIDSVSETIDNAYLIGHRFRRLPGHICFGFHGMEGEAIKLLLALDEAGIAVSSGSACSSNHAGQPSHVLQAVGLDPIQARGSLRITLGRFNAMEQAQRFVEVLPALVQSLRPMHGMTRHERTTVPV
ncbi:MAG: cysteine desulfurase family protein [Thermoguttaceae bacterium]